MAELAYKDSDFLSPPQPVNDLPLPQPDDIVDTLIGALRLGLQHPELQTLAAEALERVHAVPGGGAA